MPKQTRYAVIWPEATYAGATTGTPEYLRQVSESAERQLVRRQIQARRQYGNTRWAENSRAASGTVTCEPNWRTVRRLMTWLAGPQLLTSPHAGSATGIWALGTRRDVVPSFALYVYRDFEEYRYVGCAMTRLTFLISNGAFLGARFDFVAAAEGEGNISTLPSVSESAFEEAPIRLGESDVSPAMFIQTQTATLAPTTVYTRQADITLQCGRRLRRARRNLYPVGIIDGGKWACSASLAWSFDPTVRDIQKRIQGTQAGATGPEDASLTFDTKGYDIAGSGFVGTLGVSFAKCQLMGSAPKVGGPGYGNLAATLGFDALGSEPLGQSASITVIYPT